MSIPALMNHVAVMRAREDAAYANFCPVADPIDNEGDVKSKFK